VPPAAPAPEAESTLRNAPSSAQPTAPAGSLAGNRGLTREPEPGVGAQADVDLSASRSAQSEPRAVGTSGVAESRVARADALPQTASVLPLSGLISMLSLAGAYGLRVLRR
jgi:hypothetical protein